MRNQRRAARLTERAVVHSGGFFSRAPEPVFAVGRSIVLLGKVSLKVPPAPPRQPRSDPSARAMRASALRPSKMKPMMRSEMILSALDDAVVEGADSQHVATQTVRALTLLLRELKPLVGDLAVRALYVRSLHLARSSFERPAAELESLDQLLTPLHLDLSSRPPAQARSAAEALLTALANLLVSLIGEPLTDRLLHKAWSNVSAATSWQVKSS